MNLANLGWTPDTVIFLVGMTLFIIGGLGWMWAADE